MIYKIFRIKALNTSHKFKQKQYVCGKDWYCMEFKAVNLIAVWNKGKNRLSYICNIFISRSTKLYQSAILISVFLDLVVMMNIRILKQPCR